MKMMVTIALDEGIPIRTGDIGQAFLEAKIPEGQIIAVELPPGIAVKGREEEDLVCLLVRNLYGLVEAAARWQALFTATIKEAGLEPTRSDPQVFTGKIKGKHTMMHVHVDDFFIFGATECADYIFEKGFKFKDFGEHTQSFLASAPFPAVSQTRTGYGVQVQCGKDISRGPQCSEDNGHGKRAASDR